MARAGMPENLLRLTKNEADYAVTEVMNRNDTVSGMVAHCRHGHVA
jgi:hypothetical protein